MVNVLRLKHNKKVIRFQIESLDTSGKVINTKESVMTMHVVKDEFEKIKSINKRIENLEKEYKNSFILFIISEHTDELNSYGYIIQHIPPGEIIRIICDGKTIFNIKDYMYQNILNENLLTKIDLIIETLQNIQIIESAALLETVKIIKSNYECTGKISVEDLKWMNDIYSRCKRLVLNNTQKTDKENFNYSEEEDVW